MTEDIEMRIGRCGEAIMDFHYMINEAEFYMERGDWVEAERMVKNWGDDTLDRIATECKVDVETIRDLISKALTSIKERKKTEAKNILSLSIGELLWSFRKKILVKEVV